MKNTCRLNDLRKNIRISNMPKDQKVELYAVLDEYKSNKAISRFSAFLILKKIWDIIDDL